VVKNKIHNKNKHYRERALRHNLTDRTCKETTMQKTTNRGDEAVQAKHPPRRDDYGGEVSARTRSTSSTTTKHSLETT